MKKVIDLSRGVPNFFSIDDTRDAPPKQGTLEALPQEFTETIFIVPSTGVGIHRQKARRWAMGNELEAVAFVDASRLTLEAWLSSYEVSNASDVIVLECLDYLTTSGLRWTHFSQANENTDFVLQSSDEALGSVEVLISEKIVPFYKACSPDILLTVRGSPEEHLLISLRAMGWKIWTLSTAEMMSALRRMEPETDTEDVLLACLSHLHSEKKDKALDLFIASHFPDPTSTDVNSVRTQILEVFGRAAAATYNHQTALDLYQQVLPIAADPTIRQEIETKIEAVLAEQKADERKCYARLRAETSKSSKREISDVERAEMRRVHKSMFTINGHRAF